MTITDATITAAGPADVEHIRVEYREAVRNLPPEDRQTSCGAIIGSSEDGGKRTRINHAALITGVKPANAHSAANTAQLGFEPLATPSPALFMACASCRTPPAPDSGRNCCCDFFALADARRRQVIEKTLQMENWSRTRNGHQLIVALKVRHLLDPDFRTTLQDVADELRGDELRLEAEPVGGIKEMKSDDEARGRT